MKPTILPYLLGLTLCGASAGLLYIWLKTKDDDDTDRVFKRPKPKNQKLTKVDCTISNDIVPLVIGRTGANVKTIESKTNTKITFREKDENNQICEISGTYENVLKAAEMVKDEAAQLTNIEEKIYIPQSSYAKIVGKGGKSLQEICRRSMAKVHIDNGTDAQDKTDMRRVLITGSRTNVNTAKFLIEEKLRDDAKEKDSDSVREPRGNQKSAENGAIGNGEKIVRSEAPIGGEGPMDVYVSAIASIDKFWVQLVGPQTKKLDELVESMTEYYSNEANQTLHKIYDPSLGQIVTAKFKYDEKWYRAEIVGILPNEYNPRDVVLDLFFVDYGDSQYVAPNEVYEIRTDFLTLR